MALFARILVLLLAFLTVVFFCLKFYARAARREKLEKQWQEKGQPGEQSAYVQKGMDSFEPLLHRNLIIWVYAAPITIAVVTVYITNMGWG